MRYVYQLIGIQCFAETRFEDAGKALFNGDLDPRVIVSYFPDVVGRMFGDEDEMSVFRGVKERMPSEGSVDDLSESLSSFPFCISNHFFRFTLTFYIGLLHPVHLPTPLPSHRLTLLILVTKNLVRNYSPHLTPSSPPTAELFKILKQNSLDMLETFLRKWRTKRAIEREAGGRWGELRDPVSVGQFFVSCSELTRRTTRLGSRHGPYETLHSLSSSSQRPLRSHLRPFKLHSPLRSRARTS